MTYITDDELRRLNGAGLNDREIGELGGLTPAAICARRRRLGITSLERRSHKMSKYTPHESFDVPFEALSPRAQKLVVDAEARL